MKNNFTIKERIQSIHIQSIKPQVIEFWSAHTYIHTYIHTYTPAHVSHVCAGVPPGLLGQQLQVHVGVQLHALHVDAEQLSAAVHVGQRDVNALFQSILK
jgi:hypothetical protein